MLSKKLHKIFIIMHKNIYIVDIRKSYRMYKCWFYAIMGMLNVYFMHSVTDFALDAFLRRVHARLYAAFVLPSLVSGGRYIMRRCE